MARLMSVALTESQVRDRTKTVTRRRGEPLVRIVDVEVVDIGRERLDAITPGEVRAEGFPEMTPAEFVEFFCDTHTGCAPDSVVTRIAWRYLDTLEGERS